MDSDSDSVLFRRPQKMSRLTLSLLTKPLSNDESRTSLSQPPPYSSLHDDNRPPMLESKVNQSSLNDDLNDEHRRRRRSRSSSMYDLIRDLEDAEMTINNSGDIIMEIEKLRDAERSEPKDVMSSEDF